MNTLSKLGLTIAGAAVFSSVATVVTSDSAYAASLNGSISFTGTVTGLSLNVNPASDLFNISLPTAINSATGDFSGFGVADITSVFSPFTITRDTILDGNNSDGTTSAIYTFPAIPNFIAFSNGYSFALDAGSLTRLRTQLGNPPLVSLVTAGSLSGFFISPSETIVGLGALAITAVPGTSSSYSISLSSVPIPTPALLPGLIGLGVAALRRKQDETAEENL